MTPKHLTSAIAGFAVSLVSGGVIPQTMQSAQAIDLAALTEQQWDEFSGDNTRFDGIYWTTGSCRETLDERNLTPPEIAQLYTNLSTAALGGRFPITAGYLYDKSYRCRFGKSHAGIDIGAPAGTPVKALANGTVAWTWSSPTDGVFIAVTTSDGNQWIYGHLQSVGSFRAGNPITTGQSIGQVGSQAEAKHLHLEIRTPPFQTTGGAHPNQDFVRNFTMSPLQAFWRLSGNGDNTIPFAPPVSSRLTISVPTVDLTVNASNLPGRTVYVQMWRPAANGYPAKTWNYNQTATGTSITFKDIEGSGNSFAGVPYYTVASLTPIGDGEAAKQRTSCYGATAGKYLCDMVRR